MECGRKAVETEDCFWSLHVNLSLFLKEACHV